MVIFMDTRETKKIIDELQLITSNMNFKFDKHIFGKVISINGDTADIQLLASTTTIQNIKFRQGLNLEVNDYIAILTINNSLNNMLIDFKINNMNDMVTNNLNYRNIQIIEQLNDYSNWTGTTNDLIYYKIGNNCIRLTENDNIGSLLQTYKIGTWDLTNQSIIDDYICLPIYVSDSSLVDTNGIEIIFETSSGNYYYYNYINTFILDGFNFINIAKDNFNTTGSPDWGNITKIYIGWYSKNNALNQFISFCVLFLAQYMTNLIKVNVPTTSSDSGEKGHYAINNTHLYLCVNTNNWKRIPFDGGW